MSSAMANTKKLMRRMESKKSHSWWWDGHISPKNSKWLAENLEVMDLSVKQMLKLIDDDGDSFAKKAEMYYKKRPELVAHVEKFYRMYRALAERYDQVTGELRNSIPSDVRSQGSATSEAGSDLATAFPSHEKKKRRPKSGQRAAGFDFFLGAGPRQSKDDDSTSSSSESESVGSSTNNYSASVVDGDDNELRRKIADLESELVDVKQKLSLYIHEPQATEMDLASNENVESIFGSERDVQSPEPELVNTTPEDELRLARQRLHGIERGNSVPRHELYSIRSLPDLSHWENQLEVAQKEMAEWKSKFNLEKREVSKLQERINRYKATLADREQEIREMRNSICDTEHINSLEKLDLQDRLAQMVENQLHFEEKLKACETSCQNLQEEIKLLEKQKTELIDSLSTKEKTQEAEIERLRLEIADCDIQINGLNGCLDALKQKHNELLSEKENLNERVATLDAEVGTKGDQIEQMNNHLNMLQVEHMDLITKADEAGKVEDKMKARVTELENEVELQRKLVVEGAEEKREVIRQLCLSIEHYRDNYHMLGKAFVRSKYKSRHNGPAS